MYRSKIKKIQFYIPNHFKIVTGLITNIQPILINTLHRVVLTMSSIVLKKPNLVDFPLGYLLLMPLLTLVKVTFKIE